MHWIWIAAYSPPALRSVVRPVSPHERVPFGNAVRERTGSNVKHRAAIQSYGKLAGWQSSTGTWREPVPCWDDHDRAARRERECYDCRQ